jgi:hypothetical protein
MVSSYPDEDDGRDAHSRPKQIWSNTDRYCSDEVGLKARLDSCGWNDADASIRL